MARVTVEDCAEVVPSRFELVALAAQRARMIGSGARLTLERDNDKDAVVALREIADQTVEVEQLRELIIGGAQEKVNLDEFGVEDSLTSSLEKSDAMINSEVVDQINEAQDVDAAASDEQLLYGDDNLQDVDD